MAESTGFAIKDYVTISISILALVISGSTFYLSAVRQTKNLEGLVLESPNMAFSARNMRLNGRLEIAFVNGGNRSIGITGIIILLDQSQDKDSHDCYLREMSLNEISIPTAAFIIKPGDLIIKSWDVKNLPGLEVPYAGKNIDTVGSRSVVGCVQVNLLASWGQTNNFIPFGAYKSSNNSDEFPVDIPRYPTTILNRTLPIPNW